ncbi:MAG: metallophosphoesterase family protein [Methylocystaceae bacterium]
MINENNSNLRLNEEGQQILNKRLQQESFKKEFALVFLGDTHIGKQCKNDLDCSLMYTRLLEAIQRNEDESHNILAIIHGGDGTHRGGQHLEEFAYLTRHALGWDLPGDNRIPLLMNVGNHEYINDPTGSQYEQWIADPVPWQSYWFDQLKSGVILLNSGMNDRGGLPDNQLARTLKIIDNEIANHRGYQVVIDMHIPPSIGPQALRCLALNYADTCKFKQLLRRYPKRIAAVVSHHRHWAKMTDKPFLFHGHTPLYISAYGGHCDCPRFSCLKLTFRRHSGSGWKQSSQLIRL